jgi:cytoskeletal protein CcmA (bactofilin family)
MLTRKSARSSGVTDTLIGAGSEFSGTLRSETDIRIEGSYQGDIESKGMVVIGERGLAKSNVNAREVTIAGKVYGDVHTSGKLTITATGQLHGHAHTPMLLVQEGGMLNGSCAMERGEAKTASAAVAASGSGAGGNAGQTDKKAKQAG